MAEVIFFGLSHVHVPVRDLAAARRLYEDAIGFVVKSSGEGWVDLDAASCTLRLVETTTFDRAVSIRIEAPDVAAAGRKLEVAGARCVIAPMRTEQLTIEGTYHDADGNIVHVWRALTEDEYGFDPVLPVQKSGWDPEAEVLVKALLKSVPALFRALARWKVVREAEERAGPQGRIDRDLAIRSFISAQARHNRKRLQEPLRAQGIDPAVYQDEFDGP